MFTPIKNRKAYFNYEIIDHFEAGIVLVGTEIKAIRGGKVDISDAFCQVNNNYELEVLQMKISPYEFGNIHNHIIDRPRKLLMHKQEIIRLARLSQQKGYSLVPVALYFKKNYLKVKIALAKGRKVYDKKKYQKQQELAHQKAQQE